jgi:hypothetical protein
LIFSGWWVFERTFEIGEGAEGDALVLVDPAVGDLVNGDGIEEVELVASAAAGGDEVCLLEDAEMLCDGLTGHVNSFAELAEGLSVAGEEPVEEQAAAGICEGPEDEVRIVHE